MMHISNKFILIILSTMFFSGISYSQTIYPENEDGQIEDMLTPEYYNSEIESSFRQEINKFIYYTRLPSFQHPFEDINGNIPPFVVTRNFGVGIGLNGTSQHHPAIDLHPNDVGSKIVMSATHEGIIATYTDSPKYRHYLTITKQISDSSGTLLGKLVTIYAHLDLDLDSLDGFSLNGQNVNQGDTVSMNLYSGTAGGPHLHFEMRFYRPGDSGNEDFYNFVGATGSDIYTEPSAGKWTYGYWNLNIGYGFAHPENHIQNFTMGLDDDFTIIPHRFTLLQNYPNPFNSKTIISYSLSNRHFVNLDVFNISGKHIKTLVNGFQGNGDYTVKFNGQELPSGVYFYRLKIDNLPETRKMLLLR